MPKQWVFPDIHGCSATLEALMSQILPDKKDELIFLGDYVDRGPDAKGVLDYIMKLEEDGYNVIALKGNHEEFFINAYEEAFEKRRGLFGSKKMVRKEWFLHGGKDTLKSFGVNDIRKVPKKYISWMKALRIYLVLDNYIIVHAGLNFKNDNPLEDTYSMLWTKEFTVIPEKIDNKIVLHGHTPVSHEFIVETIENGKDNFIDLDNGVYMSKRNGFGNLMAFELSSRQLMVQPNIET